jgi:hypothetical protein
MGYGPESDFFRVPQSAVSIRTLRTKIIEVLDDVRRAPNDEVALNGWRELCSYGLAIVLDIVQRGRLPENNGSIDWMAEVEALKKDWRNLKTSEKTEIEISREGDFEFYSVQWDTIVGKFARADLSQGVAIMDKEKYNAICHRLMQFWGRCLWIIMASGEMVLDDKIETPVLPDDRYSRDKMKGGIDRWKTEKGTDR